MGWSSQSQTISESRGAAAERSGRPSRDEWMPRDPRGFGALLRAAHPACRFDPPESPSADTDLLAQFVSRLICPDGDRAGFARWAAEAVPDLLAILAPAAQRLGTMWVEDECSFCDVTLGMHRLTLLLIDLESEVEQPAKAPNGGCILIAPAPGDQHGFGTALVALFLRRAGWDVTADISGSAETIVGALQRSHFTVAGFSVGHERAIAPVSALIRTARARSCNPRIRLAVGGPMIVGNEGLAREMGADLWADDAESLVGKLSALATETV